MKNLKFLVVLIFSFALQTSVCAKELDIPELKISILTCSPGSDLYSVFGHSAIRIQSQGKTKFEDTVYNYGTFEFGDGFYGKFATGKLDYMLSKSQFGRFQMEYLHFGRSIIEQELILTEAQKLKLLILLEKNALPENRYYRYDFFYDNCATRIRDLLDEVFEDKVEWKSDYVSDENTFRDMIQIYLDQEKMDWSDFGIDIALGLPCDEDCSLLESTFLPDFLTMAIANSTVDGKPIANAPIEILPREIVANVPIKPSTKTASWLVFFLALIGVLIHWKFKSKGLIIERVILAVSGLAGLLVFFLWFLTDHSTTANNFNIVWAFPAHIFIAFMLSKNWVKKYCRIFLLLNIILLLGFYFWPQQLHTSVIPLILALILVFGSISFKFDRIGKVR